MEDLWYKNAILYSLDIETFQDSDGDGVGDLGGLIRRLEYLRALGVDVIWLAPFQPSPQRDDGYDITDYYGVEPRYGSSGDFVQLLHMAGKHGMRVILDLVVNHTSDEHRWFQDARKRRDSPFRNWYLWSKKKPADAHKGMVFPGVQESTWTKDKASGEYYFHRFYEFQPDLNFDNPDVREEVQRIMGYWLQIGVKGFRMDALPFVIETVQPGPDPGVKHFEYLADMRRFMQWRSGDGILLGEANVLPKDTAPYFGTNGDTGIHMMFNFWVNQHLFYALATGDIAPLKQALLDTRDIPPTAQWAHFLRNHDELDLGRLTEEQRTRVFERFGPEPHMQIYDRGIRRRIAPMLGERRHIELAYSILFALPGTPVLRYGDEIGMGDRLDLKERHAVRTPMQWAAEHNAGFSDTPAELETLVSEGIYSYRHVNVDDQQYDEHSLLSWMRRMIRLRHECPEVGFGTWEILEADCPTALVLKYEYCGSTLISLHNFDEHPHEVVLEAAAVGSDLIVDRLNGRRLQSHGGTFRIPLHAYGYNWYSVLRPDGVSSKPNQSV